MRSSTGKWVRAYEGKRRGHWKTKHFRFDFHIVVLLCIIIKAVPTSWPDLSSVYLLHVSKWVSPCTPRVQHANKTYLPL